MSRMPRYLQCLHPPAPFTDASIPAGLSAEVNAKDEYSAPHTATATKLKPDSLHAGMERCKAQSKLPSGTGGTGRGKLLPRNLVCHFAINTRIKIQA